MRKIPLTQGKYALVDDEWHEELSKFKWCVMKSRENYYAVRHRSRDRKMVFMHQAVLGLRKRGTKIVVDHRNGRTLDNRVKNLRVVTNSFNGQNRVKLARNNTSGFNGVGYRKNQKRWFAFAVVKGKYNYLGSYLTKNEAVRARKRYNKSKKIGEFAALD